VTSSGAPLEDFCGAFELRYSASTSSISIAFDEWFMTQSAARTRTDAGRAWVDHDLE
jgi:hypothetical protein